MSKQIINCKITVIGKMLHQDLIDTYRSDAANFKICDQFSEGQTFLVDYPFVLPKGFCPWAWGDIRSHITAIAAGADPPWIK
jgi:uncharacterized repeat protein (TIGR04076 family)